MVIFIRNNQKTAGLLYFLFFATTREVVMFYVNVFWKFAGLFGLKRRVREEQGERKLETVLQFAAPEGVG